MTGPANRYAVIDPVRARRLFKEGGWVVIGQVAAGLGSLVLVRVLTEYLDPAEYGRLALALTIAAFVNQVVMGGLTVGIGRFYSIAAEEENLTTFLVASRRLVVHATVAVACIGLLFLAGLLWLDFSNWVPLAVLALVLSVLGGYNATLGTIQNAARQRAVVAFHGGLDSWLRILLAGAAVIWWGSSSTAVLGAYVLSCLVVTGSQLHFLRRRLPARRDTMPPPSDGWVQRIWTFSWPFSVFGVFTWLHLASDRWVLQAFMGVEEVGLYAVVFQLGYVPIGLATGMAMSFIGPILYQRSGSATDRARNSNVHRTAWRITWAGLLLTLLAFLAASMFHDAIFRLLVAPKYRSVSFLLPWMILAGGVFAAGQMLALKLISDLKSTAMATAKISTAVLGVVLNIYCGALYGVAGVVGALLVFCMFFLGWMAWLAQHPPKLAGYQPVLPADGSLSARTADR